MGVDAGRKSLWSWKLKLKISHKRADIQVAASNSVNEFVEGGGQSANENVKGMKTLDFQCSGVIIPTLGYI